MADFSVTVTESKMIVEVIENTNTVIVTDPSSSQLLTIQTEGAQGPRGYGVPLGGTTHQYLRKASNTDLDTEWDSLTTDDVTEGSNLYFTDSRAKSAAVADTINNGTTDVAPSQNAVYDALTLKSDDSNVVHKTGDETISGKKEFVDSVTTNSSYNFTRNQLNSTITADTTNGGTFAFVNELELNGDFDKTSWTDVAVNNSITSNSNGDSNYTVAALNQASKQGAGTSEFQLGTVSGVYADNPSAVINNGLANYSTIESIQGTITNATGFGAEITENGGTITNAYAFRVYDVQATNKYGFYNQVAGVSNTLNETTFTEDVTLTDQNASRIVTTDASKKLDTPYTLTTDGTLSSNSDTNIPSEKAVKTYADTKQPLDQQLTDLASLSYTGNANKYVQVKATEDGFQLSTVSAGSTWGSITGTLSNQTDLQNALNAKEDESNKATDFSTINDTLYPSVKAVNDKINASITGGAIYAFSGTNSDVGGYESMPSLSLYSVGSLATVSQTVTTSPTLLQSFATNSGYPNLTILPTGLITCHFETQKSAGSNNYYCFFELYKRTSGGTETLIITSDNSTSSALNTIIQQTITGFIDSNVTLSSTDRLVVKIYAQMLSSSATITFRYDDNTDARLNLPAAPLGYVPENVDNKSTNTSLGTSDTLYPTQNAVKTYADTKLPIAGGTLTGEVTPSVVTLTDAATISVDASLGNQFTCTITASRILGNPTGATHGQLMLFAIRQNGTGGYAITFDTKYRFGDEIGTPTIATGANKTSYIGVRYHGVDDKFDVISFVSNY